ncbi:MAG: hypothetical protein Q9207_001371 [Kuettlingeria erythrocarpa]
MQNPRHIAVLVITLIGDYWGKTDFFKLFFSKPSYPTIHIAMSAPETRPSGYKRSKYEDCPIIKALGYDFDFKNICQIVDVGNRAHEGFKKGYSLLMKLGYQLRKSEFLECRCGTSGSEGGMHSQAFGTYAAQIKNLSSKLKDITFKSYEIKLCARSQLFRVKIKSWKESGEYELESAFFPGRMIHIQMDPETDPPPAKAQHLANFAEDKRYMEEMYLQNIWEPSDLD